MLKITVIMAIVFTLTGCDSESSEPLENREAVLGSGDTSEQVSEPIERSEDSVMSVQLEKIERRSPLDEHDSDSAESEDSLNESEEIAEGDQGQMDRQEPEEENVAPKRMESSDEPEMPNAGTHVFYDKNAPYKPTKSSLVVIREWNDLGEWLLAIPNDDFFAGTHRLIRPTNELFEAIADFSPDLPRHPLCRVLQRFEADVETAGEFLQRIAVRLGVTLKKLENPATDL